jgi:soluble lytic murein transglycosylase-like protein
MDFVSTRKAFPASLAVIKKHEKTIREKALQNGVPVDVAIGVGLLENGGSETAKSPAGALGVFQLMPGTARALGLTVTSKVDERKNPEKNIEAGMKYLRSNYDRFGDWGLATWAYHAGEGNVTKALQMYAKANHGITLPGVGSPAKHRAYVEKYDIDINKLLSSQAVKPLTKKLNDDSAGYPYKVIATAKLFKESKSKTGVNPGEVVKSNEKRKGVPR